MKKYIILLVVSLALFSCGADNSKPTATYMRERTMGQDLVKKQIAEINARLRYYASENISVEHCTRDFNTSINEEDAKFIMKKVAKYFTDKGYAVAYLYEDNSHLNPAIVPNQMVYTITWK